MIERAIEVLESKGYKVILPPCPSCHGMGSVNTSFYELNGKDALGNEMGCGGIFSSPCPRGCIVMQYN